MAATTEFDNDKYTTMVDQGGVELPIEAEGVDPNLISHRAQPAGQVIVQLVTVDQLGEMLK